MECVQLQTKNAISNDVVEVVTTRKESKYKQYYKKISHRNRTMPTGRDFCMIDQNQNQNQNQNQDQDELEDKEGWSITLEMKMAMKKSEWIRTELTDNGLQSMIRDIVNTEGGWRERYSSLALAKAQCPSFCKFIDDVLYVTDIVTKRSDDKDCDESFWTRRNDDYVLKTIPRKRKLIQDEIKTIVNDINQSSDDDDDDDDDDNQECDSDSGSDNDDESDSDSDSDSDSSNESDSDTESSNDDEK